MSVDLPGIRAQFELDLSLFRQQEAQARAALASLGQSIQAVPNAKVTIDTSTIQRSTAAGSQAARQMATDMTREAQRASAALDKAARDAATAQIRESQRATQAIARDFDARLAAAEKAAKDQARIAQQAAQAQQQTAQRATQAGGIVGVGLAGTGLAIAAELKAAGQAAADFDKAMSQVRAVLSPAELAQSGKALEDLALSLGQQGLGFSAVQAAQALEEMSKAGISATEQLAAAPSVLALAAAGSISVGEAAAFAANSMTVFGLAGKDIPAIVDQISGAAVATTADVKDLQLAFGQFGAVAKLSGQSVGDTITAIALLAQAGIKGSDAGTSLRTMFLRLQPATAQAAAAMRQYGIIQGDTNRFLDASQQHFRSAAEIAEVLQQTLGKLSDAERQMALETIFGSDAIRAGTVFATQGAAGWQKLTAAIGETTALEVARERLNNLAGDAQKAGAAWNNLQIAFGKQIEPNLRPLVQQFTALATAASQLSPEAQKTILIIAGGAAAFAAITGTVLAAQAAFTVAGVALGALGIAVGTVAVPVAAVTAAVALLGVAWVNDWGNIQATTTAAVARILADLEQIGRGVDAARKRLAELGTGAGAAAGSIGNALGIDANAAAAVAGAAGQAAGQALIAGFRIAVPLGGAALSIESLIHAEAERTAAAAAEEGKRIGADFVDNLAAAIVASGADQGNTFGAVAASLVADFEARGFSPDQAREAATLYMDATIAAVEAKRADLTAAGQAAGEALTSGLADAAPAADALTRAFRDITLAKNNLDEALGFAGTDQEAIAAILEIKAATDLAGKSVDDLADRSIAAAVVALRNQANEAQDAATKMGLLRQANDLLSSHIAAQKATADATNQAAEAAKKQADAEQKLGEAIRNAPLELLKGRLNDLAQSAFPALSEAQQSLIKQLQAGGDGSAAAGVALAALGVSAADAEAALHGTGAEFAAFSEHLKRIADTADPATAALKLQEASAKSMLDTLSQGLPAADRAWLQYTAAREGDAATLRALYQRMGGDLAAFDQATEAQQQRLTQRLSQARQAAEVFRSTGRLLPAPQETDLLGPQRQQQVEDQTRAQARQAQDIATQQQRTQEDRARQAADFQRQGAQIDADFAQRQTDIQTTLANATAQISHARGLAAADFQRGQLRDVEDFNREWVRQQRDRAQQDAESLRGLREQAGDLLVGATSQFHAAAAQAVQDLLGVSGSALSQAAAGVVDRFQGVGDAAQDAARQVTDAQASMLDKVRDTFQQINRQASDTIKGIRDQLLQAGQLGNPTSLFGGLFANLPGQGSPEQQAALKAAADRNQALLDANLKQAELATKQQSILDTAAKARADIDKQAADAQADLQKQQLDLQKQARDQRAQMISQLTRMVEGFQRSAFQTVQQRTDQREDQGLARDRQVEDQQRAFERQVNEFLAQQRAAGQAAADAERASRQQRERERQQLQDAERQAALQQRRQDEDLRRQEQRRQEDIRLADDRFREQVRLARQQIALGERTVALLERQSVGVEQTFDMRESVFVEPATELLEIAARRLEERVAARTAG